MLVADTSTVRPLITKSIWLSADEPAYLLFDWLSELLYAFETDKLLLAEFDLKIDGNKLTAICRGELMDAGRHRMEHEVMTPSPKTEPRNVRESNRPRGLERILYEEATQCGADRRVLTSSRRGVGEGTEGSGGL
jgi:hypothetical protein